MDRYNVSATLSEARFHARATSARPCDATLSVYPGFEQLTQDVLAELDSTLPTGMENRQFLPEVFLLDFLLAHPCRSAHRPRIRKQQVLGASAKPHFYVVPVLWRAISYLPSCAHTLHDSRVALCERMRTARRLMEPIIDGPLFRHDAEHHILLHTSTGARTDLWGWGALAEALGDPRIISLVYEGVDGDRRSQAYRAGPRSVPVPYFVEPREAVSHELRRWQTQESFRVPAFLCVARHAG